MRRSLNHALMICVLTMLSACSGGSNQPTPAPTETAAPSGTVTGQTATRPAPSPAAIAATPAPAQQVLDAYDRYWEACSAALLNLDPTLTQSVAAEGEYDRIEREIADLRARGVALRVVIVRNPLVVEITDGTAIIVDDIVNNSFYVDAATKQPPRGTGSGEVLRDMFYFRRIDGVWKVVRSGRQG